MKFVTLTDDITNKGPANTYTGEPVFDTAGFLANENSSYIMPQCGCGDNGGGCSCGKGGTDSYIYVYGDIKPAFPSQSVEKEFYQVAVTDEADKQKPFSLIAFKYLSRPENLYIARELNWLFQLYGFLDMYAVKVTTNRILSDLIEAIAPRAYQIDYDILIGNKTSSTLGVNNSELPYVIYTQLYNITAKEYIKAIIDATDGEATPEEAGLIFSNATQLIKNTGDLDKYRALNFIVLRYMKFYKETWNLRYGNDKAPYDLIRVTANPLEVFGDQKILQVIFTYQSLNSAAVQNFACSVDVSSEFPYLVIHWATYYPGI